MGMAVRVVLLHCFEHIQIQNKERKWISFLLAQRDVFSENLLARLKGREHNLRHVGV